MKSFLFMITSILFLSYGSLYAQEEMQAEKYDDPQWYWVVKVDYAPGKMDRAMELINTYFKKASDDAGLPGPIMAMEMSSGDYDMLYVWHMKEGIEGMNWKTSPNDVKWFQAMTKIAGGPEKAQEIWQEYESCIARSEADLARKAW